MLDLCNFVYAAVPLLRKLRFRLLIFPNLAGTFLTTVIRRGVNLDQKSSFSLGLEDV